MPLTEDPMADIPETNDVKKEPWDFDAFVVKYNACATAKGGWVYERDENTDRLEEFYIQGSYTTIKQFADACVGSDQFTS